MTAHQCFTAYTGYSTSLKSLKKEPICDFNQIPLVWTVDWIRLVLEKWNAGWAVSQTSAKTHSCFSTELLGSSWSSELSIHRSEPFRRSLRHTDRIWNDNCLPFPSDGGCRQEWWLLEFSKILVHTSGWTFQDWTLYQDYPNESHCSFCIYGTCFWLCDSLRGIRWSAAESEQQTLTKFHLKLFCSATPAREPGVFWLGF